MANIGDALAGLAKGEQHAQDDLVMIAGERLRILASRMLGGYPDVRRWVDTDDLLQSALLRLWQALRTSVPATPLAFFRLAALQVRRELVDLARHHRGPMGYAANHESVSSLNAGCSAEQSRLMEWGEFHLAVDRMDVLDRDLFDLLWYQEMTLREAAGVLNIPERTVRRRWREARLRLQTALGKTFSG